MCTKKLKIGINKSINLTITIVYNIMYIKIVSLTSKHSYVLGHCLFTKHNMHKIMKICSNQIDYQYYHLDYNNCTCCRVQKEKINIKLLVDNAVMHIYKIKNQNSDNIHIIVIKTTISMIRCVNKMTSRMKDLININNSL